MLVAESYIDFMPGTIRDKDVVTIKGSGIKNRPRGLVVGGKKSDAIEWEPSQGLYYIRGEFKLEKYFKTKFDQHGKAKGELFLDGGEIVEVQIELMKVH